MVLHPRLVALLLFLSGAAAACSGEPRRSRAEAAPSDAGAESSISATSDALRDAFARALHEAARAPSDAAVEASLAEARAFALEYTATWRDSTLLRRLAWFEPAAPAGRQASALADSLWRAGRVAFGQAGVPEAMRLWRESRRQAREARDTIAEGVALGAIGAGFYTAGELDSAAAYLSRARRLAAVTGDYRTLGNAVGNLASVRKDQGELTDAAALYEEATRLRPRTGDRRGEASDQNNLGLIAWALGDLAGARRAFELALAVNRANGFARYAALNLTNLGDLASLQGDYAAARASYTEALALNRAAGDEAETAFVLHGLGLLASRQGDYPAAITYLTEALAIHEQAGAALEAASARGDLAAVHAATGDLQGAVTTLDVADSLARAAGGGAAVQAQLALARAELEVQLGRLASAERLYALAERRFGDANDPAGRADAQRGRGLLLHLRQDSAGALRTLELAAERQAGAGDRLGAAVTRLLLAEVQREGGDTAAARRTLAAAHAAFTSTADAAGEVAALTPSATIWTRREGERAARRSARVLALAPWPTRLPASRLEVSGIRDHYGRRAKALIGSAATEHALRADAGRYDVLHIASFGVLNKHNPLFSFVELAPDQSDDGRLEVHEVFDLDLAGQLVVLSACQTVLASGALADVPAGDDWVGLVQSFLQAGATSVIASLWQVEDRATADLMTEMYRRLAAGESRAAALAGAQRALLRRPETAHPFYWAGFILSGSGSD